MPISQRIPGYFYPWWHHSIGTDDAEIPDLILIQNNCVVPDKHIAPNCRIMYDSAVPYDDVVPNNDFCVAMDNAIVLKVAV